MGLESSRQFQWKSRLRFYGDRGLYCTSRHWTPILIPHPHLLRYSLPSRENPLRLPILPARDGRPRRSRLRTRPPLVSGRSRSLGPNRISQPPHRRRSTGMAHSFAPPHVSRKNRRRRCLPHLALAPAQRKSSCGRPVIVGVGGQARQIVEEASAGIVIEPGNSDALVVQPRRTSPIPDFIGGSLTVWMNLKSRLAKQNEVVPRN